MPDLSSWQIHEPSGHLNLYNVKENVSEGEKLIQNWTKWLVSQPHGTNPARDKTGNYTMNANKEFEKRFGESKVFYLAGSTGGKYERRCNVKKEKAIFFPIVCDEESTAELPSLLDENKTLSDIKSKKLKEKCLEDQDNILSLEVTLDGGTGYEQTLLTGKLVDYRLSTGIFDLTFGEDNLWDACTRKMQCIRRWLLDFHKTAREDWPTYSSLSCC